MRIIRMAVIRSMAIPTGPSMPAAPPARQKVAQLAKKGKIDKSWASASSVGAEKKDFGKGEEWVVTFRNDKVQDKSKQILYVFYSLDGHYIAANFTGK